ncbi:hypothetical protein C8Q76DRAFT_690284 [Earliella scabrosa]|nr:hypothetical protein C8Q76DRAFT_690284 [Earliella scabrosa]
MSSKLAISVKDVSGSNTSCGGILWRSEGSRSWHMEGRQIWSTMDAEPIASGSGLSAANSYNQSNERDIPTPLSTLTDKVLGTVSPQAVSLELLPSSPRRNPTAMEIQDLASGNSVPAYRYPAALFYVPRSEMYLQYADLHPQLSKSRKSGQRSKIAATHLTLDEFKQESSWEWHRQSRQYMDQLTVWYRTCGPFSIRCPPETLRADINDIFIHHNQTLRYKMWVYDTRLVWVPLRTGDTQPSDPDRKLWIKKDGEPSWIRKGSYSVYRSLLKKARVQEEDQDEDDE